MHRRERLGRKLLMGRVEAVFEGEETLLKSWVIVWSRHGPTSAGDAILDVQWQKNKMMYWI